MMSHCPLNKFTSTFSGMCYDHALSSKSAAQDKEKMNKRKGI